MIIHKKFTKMTIIATGDRGGQCPTANITDRSIKFKDDYYGSLKFRRKISAHLFSF